MAYALKELKKFPIDTISDAKRAENYFVDNEQEIPVEYRREYCKNLMEQQLTFGLPTHVKVAHYASNTLSPSNILLAVETRKEYLQKNAEAQKELSDITKTAEVEEIISKFMEFDKKYHLNNLWDSKIPNPVTGILAGTGINEVPEIYDSGIWKATGDDIRNLVYQRGKLLEQFSTEIVDRFQKDPIKTMKSLQDWEQNVILRMASDIGSRAR